MLCDVVGKLHYMASFANALDKGCLECQWPKGPRSLLVRMSRHVVLLIRLGVRFEQPVVCQACIGFMFEVADASRMTRLACGNSDPRSTLEFFGEPILNRLACLKTLWRPCYMPHNVQ
jgi:hypothetical protein